MKKRILSLAISVVILLIATCGFAQDYDLIVTTKGDSIVCRIDSISDTHVYFEMKNLNKWAQTHIEKEKVSKYERNSIDKKQYVFKESTSIIESLKPAPATSIRDIPKNSVYVGIGSINYARMIPVEHVGINLAGGLNFVGALFGGGVMLMGEISLLTGGGTKHFFEPGFFILTDFDLTLLMGRIGYRYQRPGGLLFRTGIMLGSDGSDLSGGFSLCIGYSF